MSTLSRLSAAIAGPLAVLLSPAAGLAEGFADLKGHWTAQYRVRSGQGISPAEADRVIYEQQDEFFRANFAWRHDPNTNVIGDDGSGVGQRGEEEVLGMVNWDRRTVVLADKGDLGHWSGELLDADTLRVTYVESGQHATPFRAIFERRPAPAQ